MSKLTLYCAIPHRPGIDTIENGEWGIDWGDQKYAHETYNEDVARLPFTEEIKPLLPENYIKLLQYPTGHSSAAISLDLQKEHFSEENWNKVLELVRKYWPKTAGTLSI